MSYARALTPLFAIWQTCSTTCWRMELGVLVQQQPRFTALLRRSS